MSTLHQCTASFTALAILTFLPGITRATTAYEQCLLNAVLNGSGVQTIGTIRQECESSHADEAAPKSALAQRIEGEKSTAGNRFVITPHKPNYLLPISWNGNPNTKPFEKSLDGDNFSTTEIKFQLSLKAPLATDLWIGRGHLYVAYTGISWWQAYNSNSAPFRETNHEPELFAVFPTDYQLFGMNMIAATIGASHQSNGRSGSLSRSWNRIYASMLFEKDDFYLSVKPWCRIPESEKDPLNPNSSQGDDNPDIDRYMGNGELKFGFKLDDHQISMMLRNNLRRHDNKGAIQLDWSFPLTDRFWGYAQYFNGYGESLIDYNASANRLSAGVMLTDWL